MDRKEKSISGFVDRKENAMVIMASLRDATLYTMTWAAQAKLEQTAADLDAILETKIKERYRWFKNLYEGKLHPTDYDLDETETHGIIEADNRE
jgi:hypothetical protein